MKMNYTIIATSAVSMGGRSVYLGPGGSTGGKT